MGKQKFIPFLTQFNFNFNQFLKIQKQYLRLKVLKISRLHNQFQMFNHSDNNYKSIGLQFQIINSLGKFKLKQFISSNPRIQIINDNQFVQPKILIKMELFLEMAFLCKITINMSTQQLIHLLLLIFTVINVKVVNPLLFVQNIHMAFIQILIINVFWILGHS
ncbi:unnamed protein product [Paramecium sonneborni]|uniref:Transmembrane protein n=1 Tax=Paramecium sonneborni TaxID=65129 RepID=A0A8S1PH82_9CILI|nr:unnamed protein product [Paramecium sonneborni]